MLVPFPWPTLLYTHILISLVLINRVYVIPTSQRKNLKFFKYAHEIALISLIAKKKNINCHRIRLVFHERERVYSSRVSDLAEVAPCANTRPHTGKIRASRRPVYRNGRRRRRRRVKRGIRAPERKEGDVTSRLRRIKRLTPLSLSNVREEPAVYIRGLFYRTAAVFFFCSGLILKIIYTRGNTGKLLLQLGSVSK